MRTGARVRARGPRPGSASRTRAFPRSRHRLDRGSRSGTRPGGRPPPPCVPTPVDGSAPTTRARPDRTTAHRSTPVGIRRRAAQPGIPRSPYRGSPRSSFRHRPSASTGPADAPAARGDPPPQAWSAFRLPGTEFVSVFLGGGTPTTLEAADLRVLLAHLRDRYSLTADAETTTEANPDTVTEGSLAELLDAGFQRVSIGAQSFDPAVLASLERIHQPASVRRAVEAASRAGFRNVSLDLIYGANGETLESWRRTLDEALALGPEHLSAYALTIEPATSLGRKVAAGDVPGPDPDLQADMFMLACEA